MSGSKMKNTTNHPQSMPINESTIIRCFGFLHYNSSSYISYWKVPPPIEEFFKRRHFCIEPCDVLLAHRTEGFSTFKIDSVRFLKDRLKVKSINNNSNMCEFDILGIILMTSLWYLEEFWKQDLTGLKHCHHHWLNINPVMATNMNKVYM